MGRRRQQRRVPHLFAPLLFPHQPVRPCRPAALYERAALVHANAAAFPRQAAFTQSRYRSRSIRISYIFTAVTEPLPRHALRGSPRFRFSLFRPSHSVCNASSYAPSLCPGNVLVASLDRKLERLCKVYSVLLCSFLKTFVQPAAFRIRLTLLRTAPPGVCHPFFAVSARR